MDKKLTAEQWTPSVPLFDLIELDGKTLTISVGQDYDVERGIQFTVVTGTDENGHTFVLVDKQEPLDVHPN